MHPLERPDMRAFRPRLFYHPNSWIDKASGKRLAVRKAQFTWACRVITLYQQERRSGVRQPYPPEPMTAEGIAQFHSRLNIGIAQRTPRDA